MADAPRTVVVVNPASAGGRTAKAWPAIEAALGRAGVEFELRRTTHRGEAASITREAVAAGARRVVACGGDGTLNEIVDAYFDSQGAPIAPGVALGVLPSGTGGDFRRSAAIPEDPDAGARLLAGGQTRRVDAAHIEYADGTTRSFVNIADCGVGGEVVRRVNAAGSKPRGRIPYLLAVAGTVLAYPLVHARVEIDGLAIEGCMRSIVVANGRYFGGGMQIAPNAELADGQLDVILGHASRSRTITGSRHVYRGEHLGRPGAFTLRGREIRVTPLDGTPMPFDVDGEHIGAAPATIRVLPGALRLCAPTPRGAPGAAAPA